MKLLLALYACLVPLGFPRPFCCLKKLFVCLFVGWLVGLLFVSVSRFSE